MSRQTDANEIQTLAQICRKEETNLLIGNKDLSVTQKVIQLVYNDFNTTSRTTNGHNNSNIDIKCNYLRTLFRKIPSIKITGDNSGHYSQVDIPSEPLESCISLKLIRISLNRLIALQTLRPQLKSLSCHKCFDNQLLDQEFWQWFGVWPLLQTLDLSHNNITSVTASMIPSSVRVVNLSWNRIQVFNNADNHSVNNISKLYLSYNCLTKVPKLNPICYQTIECLYLRGNLIETIDGIDKCVKLIELDVGFNCLIDLKTIISVLKKCKSLRSLWIEGNPFACDRNAIELIQKEMPFLTKLNQIVINKNQQIVNHFDDKSDALNDKEAINTKSDEESELYFDASCDSMDSSVKSDGKSCKQKKLRVVEIKEQTEEVSEEFRRLDFKSKEPNYRKYDNLSEAKEMIQKRNELGDEWLISWRPSLENSSLLNKMYDNKDGANTSTVNDFPSMNLSISPPIAESTPRVDRKFSTDSVVPIEDDIEVLTEDEGDWSHKELEIDTNLIIVENMDTNETIFVYVREEDGMLFEKDCVSGIVLRTHDMKVLINVEIINGLSLKICFDSRVNSKREVKYQFDCIDSCHAFNDKFIIPWISKSKQSVDDKEILYECLKCGHNKVSCLQVVCCAVCGSDAIMKKDDHRKRRSGSDITILSQMNSKNQSQMNASVVHENNVWEELFSINTCYDDSFFTRVEHTLKLYIEVKLLSPCAGDEEVIEGLVKCKAMYGLKNRLELSYLVITNKNILILTINENEKYDNLDAYLKLNISKPITSIIQFKELPNILSNQGFWIEYRDECNNLENKSQSKSLINRFGSSKKASNLESYSSYSLIVFSDEIIGKSFIKYFSETIGKLLKSANISNTNQKVFIDNLNDSNDEMIVINLIKSANYKRIDMKDELILDENIALVVTEELVILGQFCFDANNDLKIKVLYKEYIINLMPEIYVNLKLKSFKLLFTDDNIETQFTINLFTNDVIKKLLIPIKSQWEKAFDVPMTLNKI